MTEQKKSLKIPAVPLSDTKDHSWITRGKINTECIVKVSDTTHICPVMSSSGTWLSSIRQGYAVWAFFSCFSVVIHLD